MKIKVYQIDEEREGRNLLFMNYGFAVKHGGVNPANYKCVFDGNVDADTLEGVFMKLNTTHTVGYNGHALSVGDLVENGDGCHFCDSFGFRKLENFDSQRITPVTGHRMLVIEPHKEPYEMVIPDGLEPLRQAVEGDIECTYPFDDDNAFVISNENAKLEGLDGNRRLYNDIYAGVMLIAADDGYGGITDLTDEQAARYTEQFRTPEEIPREEVEKATGFFFIPLS